MNIAKSLVLPSFDDASTFEEIFQRFSIFAQSVLLEHELVFGACNWRISELELYLYTQSEVWRDDTTHRTPEQQTSGLWYVHQYGRQAVENRAWRPPYRSGLDITVGSPNTYAGILIRQLNRIGGSGSAFKEIIRAPVGSDLKAGKWSEVERHTIEAINGCSIFGHPLQLRQSAQPVRTPLWAGPRVGIDGAKHANAPLRISIHERNSTTRLL